MRIAYVFGCAYLGIGALFTGMAHAEGTVIVPLANVTPACIDASKKTVDLWVLSARVPSDANWLRQTKGVGARVDVTLRSKEGQRVSFPAAAAIDTRDLGGKVVRASLQLHVLADQDLWNTTAAQPIRTADVSVPLTFIRRQGKSDAVKVFQALLAFTKSASAVIPANPYVKGAELVGQLSDSIGNAFAADPNDIFDPNLSLAFSIARSASNCLLTDALSAWLSSPSPTSAAARKKTATSPPPMSVAIASTRPATTRTRTSSSPPAATAPVRARRRPRRPCWPIRSSSGWRMAIARKASAARVTARRRHWPWRWDATRCRRATRRSRC